MPESFSTTTCGKLEFSDPAHVLPADGLEPHPRLASDVKKEELVYVQDAAFCAGPCLESNDVEFVIGAFGNQVGQLLQEAAGMDVEVLRQDLLAAEEDSRGIQPVEYSKGGPTDCRKDSLSKVERNLAARVGLQDALVMALARALSRRVVRLQHGWLFIILCVPVGIIRRVVWPKNNHPGHTGGAASVHTDQDIDGDPLLGKHWVLRWLLAHKWIRILNVWMPVGNMFVRPLCVMDTQTLQARHRVRHRWLDHDGWFHLHDPSQTWWWHSSLGQQRGDAIFFDTLRSPHGAFASVDEEELDRTRSYVVSCLRDLAGQSGVRQSLIEQLVVVHRRLETAIASCKGSSPPVLRALHAAREEVAFGMRGNLEKNCAKEDSVTDVLMRTVGHLQRQSIEARVVAMGPISLRQCAVGVGIAIGSLAVWLCT